MKVSHLMSILRERTNGHGPYDPLILLYVGLLCTLGFFGLFIWLALEVDEFVGSIVLIALAFLLYGDF